MNRRLLRFTFSAVMLLGGIAAYSCTSAIVSRHASASGKPMLWKHRDSSFESNFVERIAPTDTTFGYIALFNAGDSLLREAWIGVNICVFAETSHDSHSRVNILSQREFESDYYISIFLIIKEVLIVDLLLNLLEFWYGSFSIQKF